jgi:hypothetical protein
MGRANPSLSRGFGIFFCDERRPAFAFFWLSQRLPPFQGEKPCKFKCEGGCQHFEPFGTRILVIKLGATGDVLRTTPILRALKAKYPSSHITWIVDPISAPLLKSNPFIDRVLAPNFETLSRLQVEEFDLALCWIKSRPRLRSPCSAKRAKNAVLALRRLERSQF